MRLGAIIVALAISVGACMKDPKPETLTMSIADNGAVILDHTHISDRKELEAVLRAASTRKPKPFLDLRPSAHAKYDDIASVLAIAQQCGLKAAIVANEQFLPKSPNP